MAEGYEAEGYEAEGREEEGGIATLPPKTKRDEDMSVRQWSEKTEKFFKEVRVEMQKVSWPSRQSVVGSTVVVLVAVLVVSVYMWCIDAVYAKVLEQILKFTTLGKS